MAPHRQSPLSFIPSPPINGFHLGPVFIHFYGLMYVIGITLAVIIAQRRIKKLGGDPSLIGDIALWAVPAGIIGGRIYFDITTPMDIPHVWYGPFAIWTGGLGIWGGVALGGLVGAWRIRRAGGKVSLYAEAIAPALLVAQAIGRIGNYFNKELFGAPTKLPWGLIIPYAYRPPGYHQFRTFDPTFLYELIWDLALAAFLVWLGNHRSIKPPGTFALYVAGYSGFRIYEESVRIDSSEYFFGFRLNLYVAIVLTIFGLVWFVLAQRNGRTVEEVAAASRSGSLRVAGAGEIPEGAGEGGNATDEEAAQGDDGADVQSDGAVAGERN